MNRQSGRVCGYEKYRETYTKVSLTPPIQRNSVRHAGRILSNIHVAPASMEMRIGWEAPQVMPEPGQFFTILPHRYPLVLLRRPFAYSALTESWFAFLYDVVGPTTVYLANCKDGDEVDWLGPLGGSFPLPPPDTNPILVAGGAGIGPIYYLSTTLADHNIGHLVVIGARKASSLMRLHWPSSAEIRLCAEDGGGDITGTVIDGIGPQDMVNGAFYSCGPVGMMTAVHHLAVANNCLSWVSVEEMMACGVGACQGCVVAEIGNSGEKRYRRVCDEGPVFASRDLLW